MNEQEALEWMRGERSLCNVIPQDPLESWQVRTAVADAAKQEQAYWVLRNARETRAAQQGGQ